MDDSFDSVEDESEIERLIRLLEDSDKRYHNVNDSLQETKVRNRQLSISLNKEKEDRLRIKMALNVAKEKTDEKQISLNRNIEKVSQLESELDNLTQEKSELLELLENEREKRKLLENELELLSTPDTSFDREVSSDFAIDMNKVDETEHENFLQNIVVMLKKKLDTKEIECHELEDRLALMHEELVVQGEQLAQAGAEFEQQLSKLHDVLAKERHLNSLLSEESDQTVRELETKIQEKDELNTELKDTRDQASERMVSIEEQCGFYRTKLRDTEKRLSEVHVEYEKTMKEKESVSCQVNECELAPLGEGGPSTSQENETVYQMFMALWSKNNDHTEHMGNGSRHKMNIFRAIQNGFKNLGGNILKSPKTKM